MDIKEFQMQALQYLRQAIVLLEKALEELENMVIRCPNCGSKNTWNGSYCTRCGYEAKISVLAS